MFTSLLALSFVGLMSVSLPVPFVDPGVKFTLSSVVLTLVTLAVTGLAGGT